MFGTSRHFSTMRNLVVIDAQRTSIKPHPSPDWRSPIGLVEFSHLSEIVPLYLAAPKTWEGHDGGFICLGSRRSELGLTALSIGGVGLRIGLSDPSHFIRQCRKHLGMTPGELRRQRGS